MDVLWAGPSEPARGPRPALTLERIAGTAIAIADAEGLAAVSMNRVATTLGFTKMSLYRYVSAKSDLVALMVDRAIGSVPEIPDGPWWEGLTFWSRWLYEAFLAHPWTLEATLGPRPVGPHELGWMDRALALLEGTGLPGPARFDALVLLTGHVRMIAQHEATSSGSERALLQQLAELLRAHGDSYPALSRAMAEARSDDQADQAFGFGVARILKGLGADLPDR